MLLDGTSKGTRVERETAAGTVVFENGMAVVPDDTRGNDMAHELMASDPYSYRYHPGREGGTLKRDHQVMFRMPEMPWKRSK